MSPAPLRAVKPQYIPAYLSNGIIGTRVGWIPLIEGTAVVGGLSGVDPSERVEAFAVAPYPFAGDIAINGHGMSGQPHHRHFIEQRYDFECGELSSKFEFCMDGIRAVCEVVTLCNRSLPSLVQQELVIRVDRVCELTVSAGLSVHGVSGRLAHRAVFPPASGQPRGDGAMLWETNGALGTVGSAYWTEFTGGDSAPPALDEKNSLAPPMTTYQVRARPGRRYVLRHVTAVVPSAFHHQPDLQARRLLNIGVQRGFDRLRDENRARWAELWPARPIIRGASENWQALADAAFYYLHSSAHPSSLFSTAMFGLAYWPDYHYYRGHVMWDIEGFAFAPILMASPATARAMLRYRFANLPSAAENAAMNGYSGVQFPWESSILHGEEVTPLEGEMVGIEQHVGLSVAQAFAHFADATGDREFAANRAWPVVSGVCDWISSRSVKTARGYEIRDVLGIAEGRPAAVNNDAYVNMAAVAVLRLGLELGRSLGHDTRNWDEMAERLFIPVDRDGGYIRNHDAFTRAESGEVGATPEALAGFLPGGYRTDEAVTEATIRFYLERIEPYIGSPMLSAPLGVFAAWIGDRRLSTKLFTEGYAEYNNEPFSEINEFSNTRMPDKPRSSPLFANIGGFMSSLYFGLPRVRIGPGPIESWPEGRVTMPQGWDGIEVEQLWVRNRPARLSAFHGDERARLEPI